MDWSLGPKMERDIQNGKPAVPAALSRAGVTNLRRIIRIANGNEAQLFYATLDLFADLHPDQAGVHMSRFSEVVERLAGELSWEPFPDIESLAGRMAQQVVETQGAMRSEVRIRAHFPIIKQTPVTRRLTEELYTLLGIAAATPGRTRLLVGVEVEGLTVCPCAQEIMRSHSGDLLMENGFTEGQVDRILSVLPMASHNQRGRGTLLIGSEKRLRAEDLVHIVERSMSSETYELLKRPDEFYVVDKAHRNPRFVEDVVREMLLNVVEAYVDLPDDAFLVARQENFEGIHEHNAFAERYGTLGEIRREITGEARAARHTTLEDWLAA
ncbi:MAG: GTP cyclohydrolase MptA [Thermoleophilia bacterium]|nr:GTP cyclohydrolase MptA [Thermoleophilia bacterium]